MNAHGEHDLDRYAPPVPNTATGGPNLLLVVLDTARADAIDTGRSGATPALAGLASEGVNVPARSTACWTLPAHVSMLAGDLSGAVGVPGDVGSRPREFHAAVTAAGASWLPTVLQTRGWRTIGVSSNLWVSPVCGFDTGFDRFRVVQGSRGGKFPQGFRDRAIWSWEALRATRDDGARAARTALLEEVDAVEDGAPWFALVNLLECHSPYLPPRPWNDVGPLKRLRAGELARRHQTFAAFTTACLLGADVPAADLELMRHLYGRAVASLDHWVEQVLHDLDERGMLENTVVVVTSDHGENFGEAGLMGHAFSLDDRLLSVPLIVRGPGARTLDLGPGVHSLAAVPSIMATLAGLDDSPFTMPPQGVALAEFHAPAGPDDARSHASAEQLGLDEAAFRRMTTSFTAATDGRWKVLRSDAGDAVVDLVADPLELDPQPHRRGGNAAVDDLATALDGVRVQRPRPAPAAQGQPPPDDPDVAALEDQMRLLGYL